MVGFIRVFLALDSVAEDPGAGATSDGATAACRRLGRGMNLGNALEAPTEGAWGTKLEAAYFVSTREAGFDSVKSPIRWSAHADRSAPYAIDPKFLERVDWVLDQSLANKLAVVLNFHHYGELYAQPDAEKPRFLALWKQVADHYRARPAEVVFELLNEPNGQLDDTHWNPMLREALDAIRDSNPVRIVMIGPTQWNGFRQQRKLDPPSSDRRLIATYHYDDPWS